MKRFMKTLLRGLVFCVAMGGGLPVLESINVAHALTVGIVPYRVTQGDSDQNIEVRYKMRINQNDNTIGNYNKIIFTHVSTAPAFYPIGANFYANYSYSYADNPNVCFDDPPSYSLGRSMFGVGIADYSSELLATLGFRTLDPVAFPSINAGIDGNKSANGMRALSQFGVNFKDVAVEVSLDEVLTGSLDGWMVRWITATGTCQSSLPSGYTYRFVRQKVTIDGTIYNFEYIVDASRVQFLTTPNPRTEFLNNPGAFQAYIWGVEVVPVGGTAWVPLNKWKLIEDNGPGVTEAGVKLGNYNGVSVIELSRDHSPYVALYSEIDLATAPPTPTPDPCQGKRVGAGCWHLGSLGASCDAACSGFGGFDFAESTTATGAAGTQKCKDVLAALGLTISRWDGTQHGNNGCQFKPSSGAGSTRSDSTGSSASADFKRACSCKN